ncbi:hypothetical protein [Nonomuraea sp. NPDC049695]|uniref:hypothetical protein n=1 Tax=Nonomuraea sp. NPDC049695 TaxID=3154734 RepID=UPI003421179B
MRSRAQATGRSRPPSTDRRVGIRARVFDYVEHAMSAGTDAKAASYLEREVNGQVLSG